jgi:hypothetical protein
MPLTSEHNKLLKLNELDKPQLLNRQDKPQLPNKRSNNKHLSHNLNKGAIEIVVKHALQVLHHFVEGSLDIALD